MNKCINGYAFSDIQGSNSFWSMEFMPGQGKQVNIRLVNIHGNFAYGLDCVCMKKTSPGMGNCSQLFYGLDNACFIICRHDGYQECIASHGALQDLRLHDTLAVWCEAGYFKALFLKPAASVQYRWVFYGGGNYMMFFPTGKSNSLNGKIVGL